MDMPEDKDLNSSILIIDDEEIFRKSIKEYLEMKKITVFEANDGEEGIHFLKDNEVDVVITDIQMPKKDGTEVLKWVKKNKPHLKTIMITAFGTVEDAVQCLRDGAYDYLIKPIMFNELSKKLENLLQYKELENENKKLRELLNKESASYSAIIGSSEPMNRIKDLILKVSQSKSSVLIIGESGTGKELIARAIHHFSPEKEEPFIAINCGAIPENLLESELFGFTKGSFTGAARDKKGLFYAANKGTLLLDEIGELPLTMQSKLLRVLEEKEVRPIGSNTTEKLDLRVLAATNKDLQACVADGTFREDLFYRLNIVEIRVPPLRERKEDIKDLVNFFIQKKNKELGRNYNSIDERVLEILKNYSWKGNVRELENAIERTMILGNGRDIQIEDLPLNILRETQTETLEDMNNEIEDLRSALNYYERRHILRIVHKNQGDKKLAANKMGISLSTLYRKIEELNIEELIR